MSNEKAGRPEILTLEVAKKIAKLIERFPDAEIPATWDNVTAQCKKCYGLDFDWRTLSQKRWDGEKLIANALTAAKDIQKRMRNDSSPSYKTSSRATLLELVQKQNAKILSLKDELEKVRSHQMDTLDAFLHTRLDLQELLNRASSEKL
ncbi:hypothetical protein [Roseateles sp.]|uniref:hypothetical protein n=1 Tax=Roseateles sp. TaxID=1971397 RepID=UPI003D0C973D